MVLFYSSNFLGSAVYWFVRGGGSGSSLAIPGTALCCLPYLITIHRLRKNYVQKHRLFSQFENFDLDKVECSNESDRNFVYAAIGELYGSNEAFTNYVKGPLRDELLVPIANSVGPQKYAQIILSPILTLLTEYTLALWKGGAPSDVILLYAMCLVVVGVCVFNRTCIALAVLLCDHLAEPVYASSIVFESCLPTLFLTVSSCFLHKLEHLLYIPGSVAKMLHISGIWEQVEIELRWETITFNDPTVEHPRFEFRRQKRTGCRPC